MIGTTALRDAGVKVSEEKSSRAAPNDVTPPYLTPLSSPAKAGDPVFQRR
jgi:hypothetical protein